ncbi:potassium voltage-gated channel subfamily E member 3 isoform X1 [Manis pentadactyla]|uniref:potassium voltage-gated channel subfamily E member 3 isoform X1 n=1 Tax=Manis pentadactyla TaxID=143292 RepID=UPI00255C6A4E|nr:potassium voltage-gated channel subfamily E member 3 isoform X1 [Manis pentadactyla]
MVQEAGAAGDGRVGAQSRVRPSSWAEAPGRSGCAGDRAGPGEGTPWGREKGAERLWQRGLHRECSVRPASTRCGVPREDGTPRGLAKRQDYRTVPLNGKRLQG